MRYVWPVTVIGGDPEEIESTIATALSQLRDGHSFPGSSLGPDELSPWVEDVDWATVTDVATEGRRTSALVDVSLFEDVAVLLASAFDEVILAALIELPGVIRCTYDDGILRST